MKYSIEKLTTFLENHISVAPDTVQRLTEGHSSQVISFQTSDNEKLVLRVRETLPPLLADKYAYDHFGQTLPIPTVIEVGEMSQDGYYCISTFREGKTLHSLDKADFTTILPKVHTMLSEIFRVDVSSTYRYGSVDVENGSGVADSWSQSLVDEISSLNLDALRTYMLEIGLDARIVDNLEKQFHDNIPFASEVRRLLHGDLGYDNFIVADGKVEAIVDWEQMAYGDWARDFSRFEYYGIADYGDMHDFGVMYNLEVDNLCKRKALYWSIHALRDIEFTARQNSKVLTNRLKQTIYSKII